MLVVKDTLILGVFLAHILSLVCFEVFISIPEKNNNNSKLIYKIKVKSTNKKLPLIRIKFLVAIIQKQKINQIYISVREIGPEILAHFNVSH